MESQTADVRLLQQCAGAAESKPRAPGPPPGKLSASQIAAMRKQWQVLKAQGGSMLKSRKALPIAQQREEVRSCCTLDQWPGSSMSCVQC
jgi:hypothetical protein